MSASELSLLFRLGVKDKDRAVADVRSFSSEVKREVSSVNRSLSGDALLGRLPGGSRLSAFRALSDDLKAVKTEAAASGSVLAALGGGAAVATAGAAALGAAAIGAGVGVFKLAQATAEAGSRFHDLSAATGLSVETLSGLELATKQSGTSIEALGNATFLLQKNMAAAQAGNKALAATFTQLGVSLKSDADTALKQVFRSLGQIEDANTRNAVGARVFGRSYKELATLLKDTNGDLDAAIQKARELGLVMSEEAVAAADEFGDTLDELSKAAEGAGRVIGNEVIPEITAALRDMTGGLREGGGALAEFGTYLSDTIQLGRILASVLTDVNGSAVDIIPRFINRAEAVLRKERIRKGLLFDLNAPPDAGQQALGERERARALREAGLSTRGGGFDLSKGGGGGGGADKAAKNAERLRDIELQIAKEVAAADLAGAQTLFDFRKTSLEQYLQAELDAAKKVHDAELENIRAERAAAGGDKVKLRELDLKEFQSNAEFAAKNNATELKRQKAREESERAHRQALLEIGETADERELARQKAYQEQGSISFFDYETKRAEIATRAYERRKAELHEQLLDAGENAEELARINDALDQLEAEHAAEVEDSQRRIKQAVQDGADAYRDYYEAVRQAIEGTQELLRDASRIQLEQESKRLGNTRRIRRELFQLEREEGEARHRERQRQIDDEEREAIERAKKAGDYEQRRLEIEREFHDLRLAEQERFNAESRARDEDEERDQDPFASLRDQWEQFRDSIENSGDSIKDSIGDISGSVVGAMGDMRDALKEGIASWILYGDSLGKALKKAGAQALAQIAAEAGWQALKHAAWALGSLAFGDFAGAAKHGAAAAAFGALAVGAGVAGRALAKSAGLYNPGGAASTGGTRDRGPAGIQTVVQGRPQGGPQTIVFHPNINVTVKPDGSAFSQAVVATVDKDYKDAGVVYDLVNNNGRRG